jgi:DNA-binding HxlR family transcriptional regulator
MNADAAEGPSGLARMSLAAPEPRNCSIADALDVLGERWTFLVIREMVYGANRFEQIVNFTGGSRDILADRLRKLEANGVVQRRQYSEKPIRYEYHLTEAGRALLPVLMALATWGHNWAGSSEVGQVFRHECGNPLQVDVLCHACGEPVTAENVEPMSRPAE